MDYATRLDELRLLRRMKAITAQEYKREKAKADKAEEKRVEAAKVQQLIEKQRREAETRKAKSQVKAATLARGAVREEDDFYKLWRATRTQKRVRLVNRTGTIDAIVPMQETYREFRRYVLERVLNVEYDSEIDETALVGQLLLLKPNRMSAQLIQQAFRDGVEHCVFTPILAKLDSLIEKSESEAAVKRLLQRKRKIQSLEKANPGPVKQEDLEGLLKVAGLRLTINHILDKTFATFNEHAKIGSIHLTNTRLNHLDQFMTMDSDPVEVSKEEMRQLYRAVKHSKEFYMTNHKVKEGLPLLLKTLNGYYKLADPIGKLCREFEERIGLRNYKLDARKHPEVNEFLKEARQYVSSNHWINPGAEAEGCLDMKKAYAQEKTCPYYVGLMGTVHQYRSGTFDVEFMKQNLGFYNVMFLNQKEGLLERLGLEEGMKCILFSPEIAMLSDMGIEMIGDTACLGSRLDIEYGDEMLKTGAYKFFAGRLSCENNKRYNTIPTTPEWTKHLKGVFGEDNVDDWEDGTATISEDAPNVFTAHHIKASILSYLRINMILAMSKFDLDQIVRVVADGIYYRGKAPEIPLFREKELKEGQPHSIRWYREQDKEWHAPPFTNVQILKSSFLMGQGGSGKTFAILNDPGFMDVLYIVNSHKLGQKKRQEFPHIHYTTPQAFLGFGKPYKYNKPAVLLLDESTLMQKDWIEQILRENTDRLVLIAGDVDTKGFRYQCQLGEDGTPFDVWFPTKDTPIVEFANDMRSLDDTLKAEKLVLRQKIREVQGHPDAGMEMRFWASERYKPVEFTLDMFKPGDVCIVGKHRTSKKLMEIGHIQGYFKKGGYFSEVEKPGYEARGGWTIHSFQGETVENGTVFVFVNSMFEETMLYTAVSRARRWEQIRFVRL